ncbi:MAG: hypothetical protein LBV27_08875 [Oscillospiraceae bacterium]|nr:hypothetical protein [Oscillospiraceae bacterium]
MKIGESVKVREQIFAVDAEDCRRYTGETGTVKAFPDPLGAMVLFTDGHAVRIPVSVLDPV